MLGRLLYMLPFFGMATAIYFIWTADIRAAVLLGGLALTQALICLLYLVVQIIYNGVEGVLEVEVNLSDALVPITFLCLSSSIFLLLSQQIAQEFYL